MIKLASICQSVNFWQGTSKLHENASFCRQGEQPPSVVVVVVDVVDDDIVLVALLLE